MNIWWIWITEREMPFPRETQFFRLLLLDLYQVSPTTNKQGSRIHLRSIWKRVGIHTRPVAKATSFPAKLQETLLRAIPVSSRSSIASTAITFSRIPQNDEASTRRSMIPRFFGIASKFSRVLLAIKFLLCMTRLYYASRKRRIDIERI